MELWLWTLTHLQEATDADGGKLYHGNRQGVTFPLADALCWLLASRYQILDLLELEAKGPESPVLAEGLPGFLGFLTDLCHVQAARAAGEAGRVCAELVYGYNRHAAWDGGAGCGPDACDPLVTIGDDASGATMPVGPKAGPCVRFDGMEAFVRLRLKLRTAASQGLEPGMKQADNVALVVNEEDAGIGHHRSRENIWFSYTSFSATQQATQWSGRSSLN